MNLHLQGIILFVQDVEKLKEFYAGLLQLEILEEQPSQWLLLKAGAATIGLHKIGAEYLEPGQAPFQFDNNTKIQFETAEDIHTLRKTLVNYKIVMQEVKTFENYPYWICDGEDPEGNVFQLMQRK